MKAQYFLPERVDQLKFKFFPDLFEGEYNDTFLFDQVWQRFPNGRRRREISFDPKTGEKYEKFDSEVIEVGNEALDDDDFDDEFEEDKIDRKLMEKFKEKEEKSMFGEVEDGPELSSSRWEVYEAFAGSLESKGFNGRTCVLRAICETAHTEFSHETLMGELFHVFFS